jgi:homoprotocatechuate degradation regulator HpaR
MSRPNPRKSPAPRALERGEAAEATAAAAAKSLAMRPSSRSLPMQLMRAREAVMQRFRPHLRRHGITDQQWRVIRVLVEIEELEILDLSARCCLHPASLSRILPNMDAAGLIARRAHAQDLRRVIVSITPQGRRLFETVAPESERIYAGIARDIGPDRLQRLYRALDDVIEVLSPVE